MACRVICSRPTGTLGFRLRSALGFCSTCCSATLMGDSPSKGSLPLSISKRITPTE